jgi:ribonuclease PH
MGKTTVLCTASVEHSVPAFLNGSGRGWLTSEYSMIPGATGQRKLRERFGRVDSRALEIQRLIGRCLRAVTDLELLGERTIWIDCEILEADGGTRAAAITAGWVAVHDAVNFMLKEKMIPTYPLKSQVAAISVGIVDQIPMVDLTYEEDSRARVDLNVAMTEEGLLVEVQGTAEGAPFERQLLDTLLDHAHEGIKTMLQAQKQAITTEED